MNGRAGEDPHHRTIIGIDIESSTSRTNPEKTRLRSAMYDLLEQSLQFAGIRDQDHDPYIDRGDGVLVLLHPVDHAPKTLVLDTVIPDLSARLAVHNRRHPQKPFRLRAVVHAGEVHYDRHGCFGEALDLACRLLEAPELKTALQDTTDPLVLVTSGEIYRSVIRHDYPGIDAQAFQLQIHLRLANIPYQGWICLPQQLPETQAGSHITRLETYRTNASDALSSAT